MTKKTATMTALLAAIGLAVLAIPAAAQEPESDTPSPATCGDHDDTSMQFDVMEDHMGELGMETTAVEHDQMHSMMAMMHGTDGTHEMDEDSMLGPRSMMDSVPIGTGTMMGGSSMNPGAMMGSGS